MRKQTIIAVNSKFGLIKAQAREDERVQHEYTPDDGDEKLNLNNYVGLALESWAKMLKCERAQQT
jgi:adenylosuccinate lyase